MRLTFLRDFGVFSEISEGLRRARYTLALALNFASAMNHLLLSLEYTVRCPLAYFLLPYHSHKERIIQSFDLENEMLKTLFAVGTITLLSATSGVAQSAAMKACAGDVKSLCAGTQPGDGRVKACIKSHFSDVSAPCQAVLVKAAAISKACSADVKKVCADVKPGGGRIEACMKSHLSEISEPCKDAVSQATAGKS
jgi:cysteine rich repeat protein